MKTVFDKTLEQLDGQEWGEPAFGSNTVVNCHRLRRVPLKDFSVEDLRVVIGQNLSLTYLVPLALAHLELDPMVSGDLYDGDLLESVRRIPSAFWEQNPGLDKRWQSVLNAVAE